MKYKKSDLIMIAVIVALVLFMFVVPHNENIRMFLAVVVIGLILMTALLKLIYFDKEKYVSSRKRKAMEEKQRQDGQ